MTTTYTEAELKAFDALTWKLSSLRQMDRIEARLALRHMEEELGKEKLDTLWEVIEDADLKGRTI